MTYNGGMAKVIIVSIAILIFGFNSYVIAADFVRGTEPVDTLAQLPRWNPGSVWLRWTAPGDDGIIGRAAGYEMRYRPAVYGPIDSELEWAYATPVPNMPVPSPSGRRDSVLVENLIPGAYYYFCIKTYDEVYNFSGRSNSPLKQAYDIGIPDISGDINGSGGIDGLDLICLVRYLKGEISIPGCIDKADINGQCGVNGLDVAYFKAYLCGGSALIKSACENEEK